MPATPFKTLGWNDNDIITTDKLEQYLFNLQHVFENTPRGRYFKLNGDGFEDEGIIAVCGRQKMQFRAKSNEASATVHFGPVFAAGCQPNIVTGIIGDNSKGNIFCVINGTGSTLIPSSNGFNIHCMNMAPLPKPGKKAAIRKYEKAFYIDWVAYGFARDGI